MEPSKERYVPLQGAFSDPEEQIRALMNYRVFKDADALDRYRISIDTLDPKYLRTKEAAEMTETAKAIVTDALGRPLTPHWRDVVKMPD